MNREDVLKRVCSLVGEHLDLPLKAVKKKLDVPFVQYGERKDGTPVCDDLDFTELLMAFEEEFSIEIPVEDEDKVTTVNDAVEYILTAEVVEYDDDEEEYGEGEFDEGDDEDEAIDEEAWEEMRNNLFLHLSVSLGPDNTRRLLTELLEMLE